MIYFDPLDERGSCPQCKWEEDCLMEKCELHQKIEDKMIELQITDQQLKEASNLIDSIAKIVDADPCSDNLVEITKDRTSS